jgi:HPt (histidine-containing phosphotransfer) domain-containing protein
METSFMRSADASFQRPIDLVHLARQTLGDRDLEREILNLFVRQSVQLNERIVAARESAEQLTLAHTLIGSARAVGAWRVAKAAEDLENALSHSPKRLARCFRQLAETIQEANGVIHDLEPEYLQA